jgi:GNAT superfamily N-acetyltransferase
MSTSFVIGDLGDRISWLPTLASWHYSQWGPLTGADSLEGYIAFLRKAAASRTVPSVLIAIADGTLLGSVTLVASDLPLRHDLTPWLAQLFVEPSRRRDGLGAALVRAALQRAQQHGYTRVYLYTSGTLPEYYRRLGWRVVERLKYLHRERTIMDYDVTRSPNLGIQPTAVGRG